MGDAIIHQSVDLGDQQKTNSSLEKFSSIRIPANFEYLGIDRALDEETKQVKHNKWKEAWYRFCKTRGSLLGLILLILLILLALTEPLFSKVNYSDQDLDRNYYAPRVPVIEQIGIMNGTERVRLSEDDVIAVNKYEANGDLDKYYLLGSDSYGRDIWTRLWYGTRISLFVALIASAIDLIIGAFYGIISAYVGGMVDIVMQRIVEIIDAIPRLVIVTLLMMVLKPGLLSIIVALMLTSWIGMSRIARSEVLRIKKLDYIMAAQTLGADGFFVVFREIFPNLIGPMISRLLFSVPGAIFLEAFLSFLGLGIPQPYASLGSMISTGYDVYTSHPYLIAPPIVVMTILMLSFNLIGTGARNAFDPGAFKE